MRHSCSLCSPLPWKLAIKRQTTVTVLSIHFLTHLGQDQHNNITSFPTVVTSRVPGPWFTRFGTVRHREVAWLPGFGRLVVESSWLTTVDEGIVVCRKLSHWESRLAATCCHNVMLQAVITHCSGAARNGPLSVIVMTSRVVTRAEPVQNSTHSATWVPAFSSASNGQGCFSRIPRDRALFASSEECPNRSSSSILLSIAFLLE
jgi:hypothetical protein